MSLESERRTSRLILLVTAIVCLGVFAAIHYRIKLGLAPVLQQLDQPPESP